MSGLKKPGPQAALVEAMEVGASFVVKTRAERFCAYWAARRLGFVLKTRKFEGGYTIERRA